jgi:hypothetical protein
MQKLPASVLEAKGAFDKDPQRRRVDPETTGEIGEAPVYMTDSQKAVWGEIKSQLPIGVAKSADRIVFEVCVRLVDKMRHHEKGINSSETAQLLNALGRMGMTPADRTKCAVPVTPEKESNEFAEF